MNKPPALMNSEAIDEFEFAFAEGELDSLAEEWDDPDLDAYIAENIEEEGEDPEEADFFGESKEGEELEEYMKDYFLESVHKEMEEKMTIQDFERSQFELHGFTTPDDEDPDMVSEALQVLDVEILKLKAKGTNASKNYRIAEAQSKDFVSDRSFRLRFLRTEHFDAQAAAQRFMKFFDLKLDVWGEEKLGKKITLADFDENDMATLEHGHMQLLPIRDHVGRRILFNNLNHLRYQDGVNQLRTLWYLAAIANEDEDTQKKGLVFIMYKVGEEKGLRPCRSLLWRGVSAHRSFPARLSGMHVCFGRQSLPFVRLLKYAMEFTASHRVRVHEGSQIECLHTLETFGIEKGAIPVTSDGEITTGYHLDWLAKRRAEEEAAEKGNSNCSGLVPSKADVLLGRGKRAQYHPGNMRLNILLEKQLAAFDKGNRKKKREVASSAIDFVKTRGGRFLQKGEGTYWIEVDDDIARKKISHDFRTIRQRVSERRDETFVKARKEKREVSTTAQMVPQMKRLNRG